jgi:hypothetical protein
MSTNQIQLDELLARQVDVQWYEGVAIVQAICRQLLASGVSKGEFPAVAQIGMGSDGAVRVLATTSTQAVPAAAHLLAGLLSDDVPVRLRLVVSQATGENSTLESLRELSESLGYFERPDGEQIVRSLVERAMVAGHRKQTDAPRSEEVHKQQKPETAARPARDNKARSRLAAMVAAVAIVATSGLAWFVSRSGRVNAAFSAITQVIAGAPREAPIDEPHEGSNRPAPIAPKARTRPQPGHSSKTNTSPRESHEARKQSSGALVARTPVLGPSVTSSRSAMASADPSKATQPEQTYVIMASEPGMSALDLIYSKANSEVTPPRQVYPALPAEPPTVSMKRALTVVDLVIAPDGLVEHVHLRTPPRDIHEFMLLSAAKAWRFQPALLDGRAVRFRHSVALTSFQ